MPARGPRGRGAEAARPASLSPEAGVGVRGEARVGADLAHDDVRRPLVTACDADRVLDTLQAAHPGSLDGRLDVVAREHGRGRAGAVEIESPALERRLH